MCVYIYMYMCLHVYIYYYIYIYVLNFFMYERMCAVSIYSIYIHIYNIYTRTIDVDNEVVQWPMERHATIQPQVYACDRIPMFHDQPPPAC